MTHSVNQVSRFLQLKSHRLILRPCVAVSPNLSYILVPAFSALLILLATANGIGWSNDSPGYVETAIAIISGQPLSLTYQPPGLPLVLALFGSGDGVRLVHALAGAITVLALVIGLHRAGVRLWLAVTAALLYITNITVLYNSSLILTETLFMACAVVGMVLLADERHALAAITVAAALLTRYTGVALVVVAVLWLWYLRGWLPALIWGMVTSAPLGLWLLVSNGDPRVIGWHPPTTYHLSPMFDTLLSWFGALAIPVALAAVWHRRWPLAVPPLVLLAAGWMLTHVIFLAVSTTFVDAFFPWYDRMILPLWPAGLALLVWLANQYLFNMRFSRLWRGIWLFVVTLLVAFGIIKAITLGYHGSGTIERIRPGYVETIINTDVSTIYTNDPSAVYYLVHTDERMIDIIMYDLPHKYNQMTLVINTDYDQQMIAVIESGAPVIWFADADGRATVATLEELHAAIGDARIVLLD